MRSTCAGLNLQCRLGTRKLLNRKITLEGHPAFVRRVHWVILPMDCREEGLGSLHRVSDYVICLILQRSDVPTVGVLSTVSKLLRLFCEEEPLWQYLALSKHKDGPLFWKGTWKETVLFNRSRWVLGFLAANLYLKSMWVDDILFKSSVHCRHNIHDGTLSEDSGSVNIVQHIQNFRSLFLYKRWYRSHMDVRSFLPSTCGVDKRDGCCMTHDSFYEEYDKVKKPLILSGLQSKWRSECFGSNQSFPKTDSLFNPQKFYISFLACTGSTWTLETLKKEYPAHLFRCNCPGKRTVKMTMSDFVDYIWEQQDETPLYLFDDEFGNSTPSLMHGYNIPDIFSEDLFNCLGKLSTRVILYFIILCCLVKEIWDIGIQWN